MSIRRGRRWASERGCAWRRAASPVIYRQLTRTPSMYELRETLRAALWSFLRSGNVGVQVIAGNLRGRLKQRPLYVTPAMIAGYLELTGALQDLVDVGEPEAATLRTA